MIGFFDNICNNNPIPCVCYSSSAPCFKNYIITKRIKNLFTEATIDTLNVISHLVSYQWFYWSLTPDEKGSIQFHIQTLWLGVKKKSELPLNWICFSRENIHLSVMVNKMGWVWKKLRDYCTTGRKNVENNWNVFFFLPFFPSGLTSFC